ncbi:sterol desaturase family protein [Aquabacterium lacunae]|uniref:Sterol desaturase family protein n=1 Tax=Aquabacterium lacunae TaxID=2528630 RepID=A0A4V2JFD6_9BURK|nr:sterol desaturase family protein [Aquabacterium lacunae]TBO28377.1 sterol desaturase family protein [Aquabacterium lacunae]
MRKMLWSWLFMGVALATGIYATLALDYDQNKVVLYFFLPYFALTTAMQYLWPEQPNQFEKGEVWTDILNNAALIGLTWAQGGIVKWMSTAGVGLVFTSGWVDPAYSAGNLPMWAQVLVAWFVFDFMFYVTHRMAHEVDFFWRFHSVHHCAHRLSFMNASRVHPIDIIWRRLVPMFVAYQTGVSVEAMIMANTIGAVLAVITHMNVDFRFGPVNYVIGTNEMHRWHHSNKIEEAKNYSVLLFWDHLFGTYVNPPTQRRPEKMGLFNELFYPRHNFWGQLLIPFTWKQWKARQAAAQGTAVPGAASPAPAESEPSRKAAV